MINEQYQRLYRKFVINPIAPLMTKFTPSVVTLIRCTIGMFSSILYMKGFYVLTMALFMFGNSLSKLHASLPGVETKSLGKTNAAEIICDRFLEAGMFFVYCYLETDIALFCYWTIASIMLIVTMVGVVACLVRKNAIETKTSSLE